MRARRYEIKTPLSSDYSWRLTSRSRTIGGNDIRLHVPGPPEAILLNT